MKRRNFLRKTLTGSVALTGITGLHFFNTSCNRSLKLKDNFWLWGQNAGSHHENGVFGLPAANLMEPREGCDFFGIEKIIRVTMGSFGPIPPWVEEMEKIKDLKEVVWSAIGADGRHIDDQSDLDEVLRMAEMYSNVSGSVLDDFFNVRPAKHSVDSVRKMAEKLHNFSKRRLDLWAVWYTHELDRRDIDDYLEFFDVFTLWTWRGENLPELDANIQKMIERTPGKRHLAGVYMWNYGERRPMTIDLMKYQLDKCYYFLKKGYIEGLVFCSNATVIDIGLDAVDYARKWIAEVGEERV